MGSTINTQTSYGQKPTFGGTLTQQLGGSDAIGRDDSVITLARKPKKKISKKPNKKALNRPVSKNLGSQVANFRPKSAKEAAAKAVAPGGEYKIQKGDNLYTLAKIWGCTEEDILKANPQIDPKTKKINAGKILKRPNVTNDQASNTPSVKADVKNKEEKSLNVENKVGLLNGLFGKRKSANTEVTSPVQQSSNPVDLTYIKKNVTSKGTTDPAILAQAPSPIVRIKGKPKIAIIVIDTKTNVLYKYNRDTGKPENAYRVATGKKSTPTKTGIREVAYPESYPYNTEKNIENDLARYKDPDSFGPNAIILREVDPDTGKTSTITQFLHGTYKAQNTVKNGAYASGGCIRMDNDVIKDLADSKKKGHLITHDIIMIV